MTAELEQAARALLSTLNGFSPNLHNADTVAKVAVALESYASRVQQVAMRPGDTPGIFNPDDSTLDT